VSGLFIRLSTTKRKPAALRGLGNKEVAAILKAVALSVSTLLKVVTASIA